MQLTATYKTYDERPHDYDEKYGLDPPTGI